DAEQSQACTKSKIVNTTLNLKSSQKETGSMADYPFRLQVRVGRRSGRAVPDAEAGEVERLYRERYDGFTAKHFHEYLKASHGFAFGYTWTKTFLQGRGLIPKAPRRGAHRRRRPRRPMIGMMLHQDGSRHGWLESQAPLDLVITMDDATSALYSAILVPEEGTMSSFLSL